MRQKYLSVVAVIATAVLAYPHPGWSQQNPDFFVPGQQKGAGAPARPAPRQTQRPSPAPAMPMQMPPQAAEAPPEPPQQMALPPVPDVPPLPKGAPPPAAVVGVIGVPEIMRASSAAQQVEKTIGARRDKLNQDAQKEQAGWRDQQQALANQKNGLSVEQIRAKERELQERITNTQRQLRDRNRIIQEAAQFGLAQIERTLISVIRQVAESRGMNLVLHRAQVALNVNEFDLTDQVTEQLNKVLPSVIVPPDGVPPPTLAANQAPAAAAPPGPAAAVPATAGTKQP